MTIFVLVVLQLGQLPAEHFGEIRHRRFVVEQHRADIAAYVVHVRLAEPPDHIGRRSDPDALRVEPVQADANGEIRFGQPRRAGPPGVDQPPEGLVRAGLAGGEMGGSDQLDLGKIRRVDPVHEQLTELRLHHRLAAAGQHGLPQAHAVHQAQHRIGIARHAVAGQPLQGNRRGVVAVPAADRAFRRGPYVAGGGVRRSVSRIRRENADDLFTKSVQHRRPAQRHERELLE
ncbi:MAG TPA: hypothetical protein VFM37_01340 [Pseudonocardiaceae bacterium]|nr:hypothetical protein [Pseudonocardiaceae bacterium]